MNSQKVLSIQFKESVQGYKKQKLVFPSLENN
jgi:hypothetical protein